VDIRALRPEDDRSGFHSGDPDLDSFFIKYAGQNQFRHHIGTTYVAVEGGHILGFATVAPGQLESEDLSPVLGKRLPVYPLPVLRLARLAVDSSHGGKGIGKELLLAVFELALSMAERYGCIGVAVDAKPNAVGFYAHFGFMRMAAVSGPMHVSPIPVPMFITTSKLKKAQSPGPHHRPPPPEPPTR
jgi:GNAT superfamily N-acetyltransferase